MNEKTSKFLGLIEELANIAEEIPAEVIDITINNQQTFPVPVMIHLTSLEGLKKHYPDATMSDFTDRYDKESRVFFGKVEVFCLHDKEAQLMLDNPMVRPEWEHPEPASWDDEYSCDRDFDFLQKFYAHFYPNSSAEIIHKHAEDGENT